MIKKNIVIIFILFYIIITSCDPASYIYFVNDTGITVELYVKNKSMDVEEKIKLMPGDYYDAPILGIWATSKDDIDNILDRNIIMYKIKDLSTDKVYENNEKLKTLIKKNNKYKFVWNINISDLI